MDYERLYNDALERAKKLYEQGAITESLNYIFPELKESEDERIKKVLIDYFNKYKEQEECGINTFYGIPIDNIIAWLEKQGEQNYKIIKGKNYFCVKTHNYAGVEWIKGTKYYASDNYTLVNQGCEYYCPEYSKEEYDGCLEVDKLEPKFKVKYAVGEYNVVDEKDIAGVTFYGIEDEPNHIDYVKADTCEIINAKPKFKAGDWLVWQDKCYKVNYNGCGYELIDQNGLSTSLEYGTIDEGAHLWTIGDANDGDVLASGQVVFIFMMIHGVWLNCYCSLCSIYDDESFIAFSYDLLTDKYFSGVHPATKEQRDLLFSKMKEEGYEWNDKNKELKKTETKGGDE